MVTSKEKYKSITNGYFYACSPYCKTILTQGKNGTDTYSRYSTCNEYMLLRFIIAADLQVSLPPTA